MVSFSILDPLSTQQLKALEISHITNAIIPAAMQNLDNQIWKSRISVSTKLKLYKKAQLSLTNPRDAKACRNCFNSACLQRCR